MYEFLNMVKGEALPLHTWDSVSVSSYPMLYLATDAYYIKVYEKCPASVLIGVISITDDKLLFSSSSLAIVENVVSIIEIILSKYKTKTSPNGSHQTSYKDFSV